MNTILLSEPIEESAVKLLEGKAQVVVSPDPSDATVGRLLEGADALILRTATRVKPSDGMGRNWEDVPDTIKQTFDRLGVPEAERKFLAGVGAQYESQMVYHKIQEQFRKTRCDLLEYRRWSTQTPGFISGILWYGYTDRRQ